MTDGEKAEEHIKKEYCEGCMWENACNIQCEKVKKSKQAYLDGLAEGRKEVEAEKCELLGIIQGKDQVIAELKAELKQIIERERVVPEHYLCEMIDKNKELKEQIEKMKCCDNCKNVHYEWGGKVIDGICHECRKYDKWELIK